MTAKGLRPSRAQGIPTKAAASPRIARKSGAPRAEPRRLSFGASLPLLPRCSPRGRGAAAAATRNQEASMSKDIYQTITDRIVRDLEQGVRPWQKPWSSAHMLGRVSLPLRHNGVAYRGVNILALWMEALTKGYAAPIWMTFKQALELGGRVRKGEKGSPVVYANSITRAETDATTGEETARDIHYLKGYTVFNTAQIDGLPEHYYATPAPRLEPLPRIARAEAFFAATRADIRHGGNGAYYSSGRDHIQ